MPPVRTTKRVEAGDPGIERRSIAILRSVFAAFRIPESYYCLNGFADSSLCLSKENGLWQVFIGERGKKTDVSTFKTANEACKEMIRQIGDSSNREEMMFDYLRRSLLSGADGRSSLTARLEPTAANTRKYAKRSALARRDSGSAARRAVRFSSKVK